MKRCNTTDEYTKIFKEMGRSKFKGIMVSVQSMYETASAVLNVEFALNLITLAAGLILFCIILIGVVNTLRMTIRERTREIGTMRASGCRRKMYFRVLLETGFLTFRLHRWNNTGILVIVWPFFHYLDASDDSMGMLLSKGIFTLRPHWQQQSPYIVLSRDPIFTDFFGEGVCHHELSDALRHVE